MKKIRPNVMIEIAILASMAMLFDYFDSFLKIGGISISISMLPIMILAIRRGPWPTFLGSMIWVLLQFVTGDTAGSILHPLQGFLEYPVAFGLLTIAGFAYYRRTLSQILIWSSIAIISRYFIHFIAGWVYWGIYAPEGTPAWIYSLILNGQTLLINLSLILIILTALYRTSKYLFIPKN